MIDGKMGKAGTDRALPMCESIHVWRLWMRIMCERDKKKKISDVLADGTLQMRMAGKG